MASPTVLRRKIVGVICCAEKNLEKIKEKDVNAYNRLINQAEELGAWLAEQDVHLLTGGGGGLMEAVSDGFFNSPKKKGGLVLGIIPGRIEDNTLTLKPGYPNQWVEIPLYTHLPGDNPTAQDSRNHINVLTSDVLVVLPGGGGTQAEMELANDKYKKTVAIYMTDSGDMIGNQNQASLDKKYSVFTDQPALEVFIKKHI